MSLQLTKVAQDLMETIPPIMRFIREEMRQASAGPNALSVPQFRSLAYLKRCPGAALFGVAEHLGVTPATASTIIDRLVRQGLVDRQTDPEERRRHRLTLTAEGQRVLAEAWTATRRQVEAALQGFATADLDAIADALCLLSAAFPAKALPDR